ncbi:type IA DNA topoisomerase [uncultured Secundilactobacillus sp.]|uniref:type IA DNA topoisomerase n=1 Tax=uncultured Secundilactobacillus sp. TaxID=2813935 RepID=UPI00258AA29D|nr:type IA DNA topoisomerase [uncultured Secundilactobacillus sp.]
MTIVVLTEKNEQIKPYAAAVGQGPAKKIKGIATVESPLLGDTVQFVAASGHLFKLVAPEAYNPAWADRRNYQQLPVVPPQFKVVIKDARTQTSFNRIKQAITQADAVILATDPDQQGETIGREILAHIPGGLAKCQLRLLNSSLTAKGARKSFEHLVPMDQQAHLGEAGELQNHLNWLVGINLSRVAGIQLRQRGYYFNVAAGTVKTPTLALIVANDEAIKNFKSQPFWQLQLVDMAHEQAFHCVPTRHFNTPAEAQAVAATLNTELTIQKINEKPYRKTPPKLFNLTSLQGYAAKKWGYSGQEVMETMERLYKDLHLTSYPRTDSVTIEAAEFNYLKAQFKDYLPLSHWDFAMSVGEPRDKVVVKDTGGHPALIPTDQIGQLAQLTERERRLYRAVIDRTLLMFAPDCQYLQVEVQGSAGTDQVFQATGRRYVDRGWTTVSGLALQEKILPDYQVGQQLPVTVKLIEGQTKCPKRLTESQLYSQIFPKYNLGTSATRAAILTELIEKNQYVTETGQQRELRPTDSGRIMVAFWQGTLLTDLKLAKTWQDVFDRVISGEMAAGDYQQRMVDVLRQLTQVYQTRQPELPVPPTEHAHYDAQRLTPPVPCPQCRRGKVQKLIDVQDQKAFYACDNTKCHWSLPTLFSGVELTDLLVRQLIEHGRTDWLPQVVSSKGKQFKNQVAFKLDDQKKVAWVFKPRALSTSKTKKMN